MKKYNRIIKVKMNGNIIQYIHKNLRALLDPEKGNITNDHNPNITASILMDVEKKMNKPLAKINKPSKVSFKYHEASALLDFLKIIIDTLEGIWLKTVVSELIAELDKQMK